MARLQHTTPKLNMTPLIDVVFLLLIFFMVTTTFIRRGLDREVRPPGAEHLPGERAADQPLVIGIRAGGELTLGGRPAGLDTLAATLSGTSGDVVVRTDARAAHEHLLRVLEVCADASRTSIELVVIRRR